MSLPRWRSVATLAVAASLLAVYLPAAGHGFVKDDFRWVLESRVRSAADLVDLFRQDNGFYRPVVSLSFAVNEWWAGASPRPYGLVNLAVMLGCAAALAFLARGVGLPWGAALLAAGLWSLNPHGTSGLVLWISGRTSGLLTLFSLLAALALVHRRRFWALVFALLAVFSKEEAVLLPAILVLWGIGLEPEREGKLRRALGLGGLLAVPLVLYFLARSRTAAYLPTSAPAYYRFTFEPALVFRNVLEYADRAATLTVAALLVMALALRSRPRLGAGEWRVVRLGAVWLLLGFALTVFVPARSSLYVCFPSVGVALAGAAVASALWRRASPVARARLAVAGALLPLALVPLLRARDARSVHAADLSSRALADLRRALTAVPRPAVVVLEDRPELRPDLSEAWGGLVREAVALTTGLAAEVEYQPGPVRWTRCRIHLPPPASPEELTLALRHGRLERVAATPSPD